MNETYVAYFRVSTDGQGLRGLGMSAQRDAVQAFLAGGKRKLIGEFAEVESAKLNTREQLANAMALCRKAKATLLIAKLDRLSRNAAFTLALRDSGTDFVCCDMPFADRFTIGLFALLAEKEREMISERTKAGLAAAKRRGTKLGNPKLAEVRARAIKGKKRRATEFAQRLALVLAEIERAGVTTLRQTAFCLNARGFKTPMGKAFTRHSVKKLKRRLS